MRPTLQARELKESLLQYLSTTYALADEGVREALHRFLGDESSGMFRGPYLRVRTPFVEAGPDWQEHLEWRREGWTPYAHQAAAFARLTSADGHAPQPTMVTTGTSSGKTEAFLYPVLDHCRRERAAGRSGIKAVLLYPMNALANDQAQRINKLLTTHAAELNRITAGLYVGDRPSIRYDHVLTSRLDMQLSPPDILLTNYKMLDLLLQRSDDAPLWQEAAIRYVVVDEFHTYDGAQGTDVAMLLRRLASAVGAAQPRRPLGDICPVATSATLASSTDEQAVTQLAEVATRVFGTTFTTESIITEQRRPATDFVPSSELDPTLPQPKPEELLALPDPTAGEKGLLELIKAVAGDRDLVTGKERDTDRFELGRILRKHLFTHAVMQALDGDVKTGPEVLDIMWRTGASSWARSITEHPDQAAEALARFVALLSYARDPESTPDEPKPFVHVEVHQWARSVSRLLRGVLPWPKAEFRWEMPGAAPADADHSAPQTTATAGQTANLFLPAVYCRDCGRSGWAVFSPESDDLDVQFDTYRIRRSSTGQDKIRVRNLIAATDEQAREGSGAATMSASGRSVNRGPGGTLMVLDGVHGRLRLPDPARDYDPDTRAPRLTARDSAFVLVNLGDTANTAAREDWCPACGERNAIRYLGTGAAALASASLTQMFTGGELDPELREDKTLMFNDSVQDAAHRAGFVANRSYTFSLRALLTRHLRDDVPTALNDLIADVVKKATDEKTLAAVVPPDLHGMRGVNALLSGTGRGRNLSTWRLIGQRLAFETLMEFGFRSRNGRTLELTRTAAAQVRIADPAAAVALVKTVHLDPGRAREPMVEQDDARYLAFLRVFLERLRARGAVNHRWLNAYLDEAGTSRYHIWGGRQPGMRAFPNGIAAPLFLLDQPKTNSDFDAATGRLTWYEVWARRCLELSRDAVADFWSRLLPELAHEGLLSVRTPRDSSLRVYGLQPGHIDALLLDDVQVRDAFVRCPVCFWEQTVHPSLLDQWDGQPCPTYRCREGRLVAGGRATGRDVHRRDRDYTEDYYRRLYRRAGTYQIVTAEHTGMLTRAQREQVEQAFKNREGFPVPNVLCCTPTLEMGIDIGELSALVLAALPHSPANYVQQVGRGGRRTGNSFVLTIPNRRHRDLYFLERPRDLIAGPIVPPGCYLSAVEILRRQYVAHLLDLAAAGRLVRPDGIVLRALPAKAPGLFGPSGYLEDLKAVALAQGETLVDGFLTLFPDDVANGGDGVSEQAKAELREFATHGLGSALEQVEARWRHDQDALKDRRRAIDDTIAELHDSDPEQSREKKELDAERRNLGRQLMALGDTPAQAALCELGVLPNYALIDSTTTLSATLYGEVLDPNTGQPRVTSDMISYQRPRRHALTELAPGNSFYVNGYRHDISGLEITAGGRRAWRSWRLCPECGYVRTENATADRSACPRCGSTYISDDGSCLFQVVEPVTVTSRDRRDDARIRDDRDDREPKSYVVVDAVDMPEEELEPGSWRHATKTFGVDYCRRAMIRKINIGPRRFDARPRDHIFGHQVRMAPFHVCTGCGAATADGKPLFDHDAAALSSSAVRAAHLKHHRPWCPLRRGRRDDGQIEPVLLAHQLGTEALRVLIPVVAADVEAKVYSFRAALRLGVDLTFGGDPQHLDATVASMPDQKTGQRRQFLVLYDMLPGGTGYLDRLKTPEAFRDTLTAAYQALDACPCAEEQRRACHRCLYQYTPAEHQNDVSRGLALRMLGSLLFTETGEDGWATTEVAHTGLIGLDAQVESDLEARFLAALRDWVNVTDDVALDEDGHASGHLRFTTADSVMHWRLTAQQQLAGSRPDFVFTRQDGPSQRVTVYLEGFRFHASPEHNKIAAEAATRNRLRADGEVIFQITWDDVTQFEEPYRSGAAKAVWPPYLGTAQETAKQAYDEYGGDRAHFDEAVFVNPIDSLIAYLRDPDVQGWSRRARALVTGLVDGAGTSRIAATGDRSELEASLRDALEAFTNQRRRSPQPAPAQDGPVHVFDTRDVSGLPIVVTLDAANVADLRWSALLVLDDSDTAVGSIDHHQRWRAWLYWTNLTQFLVPGGGDCVQLATSRAAMFSVDGLAVCAGLSRHRPASEPPDEPVPEAWREILDILREDSDDSPELLRLAEELARRGAPPPVFGYELGSGRWQADFAWDDPTVMVAVMPPPRGDDDQEAQRGSSSFTDAGWIVRTAADWLTHLDELLAHLPTAEGTT